MVFKDVIKESEMSCVGIEEHIFFDKYQSTYLPHRSTETALTLIINDILMYLDNKAQCYLVQLYLSDDFITLDHDIISIGLN